MHNLINLNILRGVMSSLIKQKLAALQSNNNRGNYVKVPQLKLTEGSIQVRLLPNKYSTHEDYPFVEKTTYYNFNGKKIFLSPATYGEPDPILEFLDTIKDKKVIDNMKPSTEIWAPVLVRDRESEGVIYWKFSSKVLEQILLIMDDEDYGNIHDLENGTDLTVTYTPKEKTKTTKYPETKVTPKRKSSPALENKELLKRIMDEQVDLLSIGTRLTYDEISNELDIYMQSLQDSTSPTSEGVVYNDRFDNNNNSKPQPEPKTNVDALNDDIDALFK